MSHHNKHNSNGSNHGEESKKDCGCNVGEAERVISAVAGGYLLFKGLKSGSILGLALGAAGLYRAASGHCQLYKALGVNTNTDGQKLANVAEQASQLASGVVESAKSFGNEAAEQAKALTNDARNRVADAIATK